MCPKQTVCRRNIEILAAVVPLQQVTDPVRVPLVVTMTVGTVVHDLTIEDMSQLVDLPEDDTTITTTAQSVALHRPLHLLLSEITTAYHRPTERTLCRQSSLPHRSLVPNPSDRLKRRSQYITDCHIYGRPIGLKIEAKINL